MKELCIVLFASHLLGDFVFQPDILVKAKEKWRGIFVHIAILTVTTTILVASKQWQISLAVCIGHFGIDAVKRLIGKNGLYAFIIDQVAHVLVIVGIAYFFPNEMKSSLFQPVMSNYINGLVLLSGLILTIPVGTILISKATASFTKDINAHATKGLTNGGKWIGQLERALSFILIIFNQAGAIGFLFAAKSILRFGEIKNPDQRKDAEYIIIGTFMSFGWAILIANLTMKALELLKEGIA